jgi:hypothetical protein
MSGKGVLTTVVGHVYEGSFLADAMHGEGKYLFNTGDVYEGTYVSNKRSGKGIWTFPNGNVYVGTFTDDKFENGRLFLDSENSEFDAVFAGGDEIINGARVYFVTLRKSGSEEVVKNGKFSRGSFL